MTLYSINFIRFKSYKSIILSCSLGILQEISFFSSIFTLLLHKNIASPAAIGIIIACRRGARLLFDIPGGFYANKMGVRIVFLAAKIAMIIMCLLVIFLPLNWIILLSIAILEGFAKSAYSGKVEGFVYTTLAKKEKSALFSKVVSLYYFIMDISIGLSSFIIVRFYNSNYKNIFIYSLAVSLISIIFIYMIDAKDIYIARRRHLTIQETFKSFIEIIKEHSYFINLIIIWGLISFLGRQASVMLSFILIENGYFSGEVIKIQGSQSIIMGLGCIPSFFMAQRFSLLKLYLTLCLITFIIVFFSIISNIKLILAGVIIYQGLFASLEVALERIMDKMVPKKIRLTLNSLITSAANSFNMIGSLIFGVIASRYSYKTGWLVIMIGIFITCIFGTVKVVMAVKNNRR